MTSAAFFHRIALALIFLSLPCLLSAQTLLHRYSFATNADDSVGNANGTVVAPSANGTAATIANGLTLPGGGGGGFSGYVSLPGGILTNTASLTIEVWVTQNSPQQWATIWDFANNDSVNFELCPFPQRNIDNLDAAIEPNGGEIDTITGNLFPSGSEQYVAFTFAAPTLTADIYTNGDLGATWVYPNTTYIPGTIGGAGGTTVNALGNDIFGDAQFQGTIYEFRIWNGVIPGRQIGASALLGSSVLVTNLTPTAISATAGSSIVLTGTEQADVTVQLIQTGTTNVEATTDATWVSGNTNILTVNSNGLISGVGLGSTTVSATIDGHTATTGLITVTPVALAHRYSFVADATDSVSNADGVLQPPNGGDSASISNGLVLPGNRNGGNGYSGYVSLPAGLINGFSSLTVECWVTQNQGNTWAEVWDFANNINGFQNFGLIPDPGNNNGNIEVAYTPTQGGQYVASDFTFPNGTEQYVCSTYNNSSLTGYLYNNGTLLASQTFPAVYDPGTYNEAEGGTSENYLGNDIYGDYQFDGTIYELRIWLGAVSPLYVAASEAAGPSVVVTNTTVQSLTVTVPTNSILGAETEQATVTANFAQVSSVPVTGAVTNWTSSDTNILTVSSGGLITGVSGGSATVSATAGGVTATSESITVGSVSVDIALSGTNVVISWPTGVLLSAPTLLGPWTTNSAITSPFTVAPTNGASQFYKVLLN